MKKSQPALQENRIDALANRMQKEGELDQLEPELLKYDPASLQGAEKESWYHLYGIVSFQAENHPQAFERFQEGLRQCPDSAVLAFALGQEYEYKAEIQTMLEYFDRAKFPRITAAYTLAKARYAYLWNRNMKGLEYVQPVMDIYFRLKILDSTFLYMRGMPFFEQTWAYMAAFHYLLGDTAGLKTLTDRAERACSDFDFPRLRLKLGAIETGDHFPLKERLTADVAEATQNGWPVGYLTLQLRVLEAQSEDDTVAAERLLDAVEFAENDFPWLDDMRMLAKCELANRAQDEARESELLAEFFKRQPMIFEPDNAINFNLLAYQEKLKGKYQKARRENN
jgi:hypothetical protein